MSFQLNQIEQNYEKIQTYKSQLYSVLDDFKKSYVTYKSNPDISEYKANFSNQEAAVNSVNKDLFILTNDIENNINIINSKIVDLNAKIEEQRKLHESLLFHYQQSEGFGEGSKIMIDNTKELYKKQYISNFDLLFGLHILMIAMYFIFLKKSPKGPETSATTPAPVQQKT